MKIKIEPSKKRRLEIDSPNGEIVMVVKDRTVQQVHNDEVTRRGLEKNLAKNQITSVEYMMENWKLSLEDFDPTPFLAMPFSHLEQIAQALRDLLSGKEEEEKKNH